VTCGDARSLSRCTGAPAQRRPAQRASLGSEGCAGRPALLLAWHSGAAIACVRCAPRQLRPVSRSVLARACSDLQWPRAAGEPAAALPSRVHKSSAHCAAAAALTVPLKTARWRRCARAHVCCAFPPFPSMPVDRHHTDRPVDAVVQSAASVAAPRPLVDLTTLTTRPWRCQMCTHTYTATLRGSQLLELARPSASFALSQALAVRVKRITDCDTPRKPSQGSSRPCRKGARCISGVSSRRLAHRPPIGQIQN
jgi:hypothetical protein